MEIMQCPHCGAGNSAESGDCAQCGGRLQQENREQEAAAPLSTCGSCRHASIYAPVGQQIRTDQVWCLQREAAVPSEQVGGTCYEQAFGWKREDIVD